MKKYVGDESLEKRLSLLDTVRQTSSEFEKIERQQEKT